MYEATSGHGVLSAELGNGSSIRARRLSYHLLSACDLQIKTMIPDLEVERGDPTRGHGPAVEQLLL